MIDFGFKQEDLEIRVQTYKTLAVLVQFFKPKVVRDFKIFQKAFLNVIEQVFIKNDIDLLKKTLSILFDVCSYSPNFIKKYFQQILIVMTKVRDIDFDDDNNIKIESVECLLNFISRYPDLVKNDQQFIPIIELIFKNMLELENEISEEWSCPPDGFNDDLVESDDQKVIKAAM